MSFCVTLVGGAEDGQCVPKVVYLSRRYTKVYQATAHFLWPASVCVVELVNLIVMGVRIADKPWITESSSSSVNISASSSVNDEKRRSLAHCHNYMLMGIGSVVVFLGIFHILCLAPIYIKYVYSLKNRLEELRAWFKGWIRSQSEIQYVPYKSKGHFRNVGRWVELGLINGNMNTNLLLYQLLLILVLAHIACLEYILTMDEKYYFSNK